MNDPRSEDARPRVARYWTASVVQHPTYPETQASLRLLAMQARRRNYFHASAGGRVRITAPHHIRQVQVAEKRDGTRSFAGGIRVACFGQDPPFGGLWCDQPAPFFPILAPRVRETPNQRHERVEVDRLGDVHVKTGIHRGFNVRAGRVTRYRDRQHLTAAVQVAHAPQE